MAIIKHIPVKNRFYTAAVQYLSCQYDERTNQPLLDAKGRLIEREEYRIEGYNCDVDTFGADCIDVNRGFGKNNAPKDVKAHHYIISFAPEDDIDMDGAMDFGKQWIEEFVPGHQAIIAAHSDGHNGSRNVHVHIVFNSVRKYAQEPEYWHEKPCEYKEGCKHRSTGRLMRAAKEWVMDKCKQLGLRQVDLLTSKHTDHYRVKERLEEKERKTGIKQLSDKDMIRQTIDGLIPEFEELHDLINCLQDDYGWKIRVTPQTISYQMPGMKRPIRGKRLGKDYEFVGLIMRFVDQQIKREEEQAAKEQAEREAKVEVVQSDEQYIDEPIVQAEEQYVEEAEDIVDDAFKHEIEEPVTDEIVEEPIVFEKSTEQIIPESTVMPEPESRGRATLSDEWERVCAFVENLQKKYENMVGSLYQMKFYQHKFSSEISSRGLYHRMDRLPPDMQKLSNTVEQARDCYQKNKDIVLRLISIADPPTLEFMDENREMIKKEFERSSRESMKKVFGEDYSDFDAFSVENECQDEIRKAATDRGIRLFTYENNPFAHYEDKHHVRTR